MKIFRLLLIFLSILVVSFLLYLWIYGSTYIVGNVANALFVVGMITFLPTIIAMTQAYKFFQGFNYAIRSFISTAFRENYPKFSDYKAEKRYKKLKTTVFLEAFIASGTVVILSIIFTVVAIS